MYPYGCGGTFLDPVMRLKALRWNLLTSVGGSAPVLFNLAALLNLDNRRTVPKWEYTQAYI